MRKLVIIAAAAMLLGGCSFIKELVNGKPATPQEVAAAENAYIAADMLAMSYMMLPTCAVPRPASGPGSICSDPATKLSLKQKEMKAYQAFTAFQAATAAGKSVDAAAMETAIDIFVNSIPAQPAPK